MSFSKSNQENSQVFNNADSFAMAFDEAWGKLLKTKEHQDLETEMKMIAVLELIKDHPFLKDSPSMAKEVAIFRVRLLELS